MNTHNEESLDKIINGLRLNEAKLIKLQKQKNDIKQHLHKNPPNIVRTIKSNFNNQMLTVQPYDLNSYQIQINDKCMTVYDDNKYLLEKCNTKGDRSDTQKFSTHRIKNNYNAESKMGRKPNKIVEYPYNIFKSELTNQCLTIDNDGVSVQNCLPDNTKQHFKISDQQVLCKNI